MAEIMGVSRILILERNRLTLRKVTRVLSCVGVELIPMEDPSELPRWLDGTPSLLCADAVDIATVVGVLQTRPEILALVWTGEKCDRLLPFAHQNNRLSHILGRMKDQPPREWELLWAVRRILSGESPGLGSLLAWGYTGFKEQIRTTRQRDACVEGVVRFCEKLNCAGRVREMFGELAHELLMNAMYDAPVDASGRPKYASDRKAQIALEPNEAAVIRAASDGMRLVISVTDPFGRLPRNAIFAGIARGLQGGEMDTTYGGAGLGMLYIYKSAAIAVFDVVPGRRTQVVGIYELDTNQREFRSLPRSIHYYSST
ncbi:MAG: hypothetical protein ABI333_26495 [bacterium]